MSNDGHGGQSHARPAKRLSFSDKAADASVHWRAVDPLTLRRRLFSE